VKKKQTAVDLRLVIPAPRVEPRDGYSTKRTQLADFLETPSLLPMKPPPLPKQPEGPQRG
jgi:hypothetical protein